DAGCLAPLDPVVDGPAGIWVLDGDIHRISSSALGIHPSDCSVRTVGDPSTSSCPRSSPTSQAAPRGTLADTIPALYKAFWADFVRHLEGSFCIAVYDPRRGKFILANDRFSTRTMYWAHIGGPFFFASEFKGLMAVPSLPQRLDVRTLSQFFAFNQQFGSHTL